MERTLVKLISRQNPRLELFFMNHAERIEQYLLAEPFQPFVIEMGGGKTYRIDRRAQCGFSRHGSVQLSYGDEAPRAILSSAHIIRVQKT